MMICYLLVDQLKASHSCYNIAESKTKRKSYNSAGTNPGANDGQ